MATAKVLLVGWGASGSSAHWAGGGAGGYLYDAARSLAAWTYEVVIGAGGPSSWAWVNKAGQDGSDTTFDWLTTGGGGKAGAGYNAGSGGNNGGNGRANNGSGGGAGGTGFAGTGGTGNGTGHKGGNNYYYSIAGAGGGGGWANEDGFPGTGVTTAATGWAGGAGAVNPISGSTVGELSGWSYYVCGGGGGSGWGVNKYGLGGLGGGGRGGASAGNGFPGLANSGGGGGGSGDFAPAGGPGGSGAVVISFVAADVQNVVVTGLNNTVTVVGSDVIVEFRNSWTLLLDTFRTIGVWSMTGVSTLTIA